MTNTERRNDVGCPVRDYRIERGNDLDPGELIGELSEMREQARVFWTPDAAGYYVLTRHSDIVSAFQSPEVFSSARLSPNVPNPGFDLIPITMDPPMHTKWRRVIGSYFTPKRAEEMQGRMREVAAGLIDELRPRGRCELVGEFTSRFPAAIFLELMGLPQGEMDTFLGWVSKTMRGPTEDDPEGQQQVQSQMEVMGYLWDLVQQRKDSPDPGREDIISHAHEWVVDGEPPTDQDILLCCLTMFQAGLDTVNSTLSYFFHHLATHPSDRQRIVADPAVIPRAVEELLRAYPIARLGREVAQDTEVAGCPMKQGDMVLLTTMSAARDPEAYPEPDVVDFDRENTRHVAFGAGPHRCIGSHIARRELAVALQEWHARIPDYTLDDDAGPVRERSGQMCGLATVPLRW